MRVALCLSLALFAGCGATVADAPVEDVDDSKSGTVNPTEPRDVPDLGTRKHGVDWSCFLGPTGDSKSSETGIISRWTQQSPRIVWQQPLGTSYGAPTISMGRLFQFDRPAPPPPSELERGGKVKVAANGSPQPSLDHGPRATSPARLTCLNSETGKELWHFEYPTNYEDLYGYNNGPRCSPVVDDDRVYIFGAEGMLHCLEVVDGKPRWKIDTAKQYRVVQNFFGVGSTPVIEGDLLIVHIGGSTQESLSVPPGQLDLVKGDGSGVVAFNKYTGKEQYRLSDELASYSSPTLATIDGRRWCFMFARGGLLGFEPASGKLDFHYPWRAEILESVNASNPVVVGNRVFISETYGPGSSFLEVQPGSYKVLWSDEKNFRAKSMQTHWNTAIHHEGYLYGSSGRHTNNAELRCIELATGKVMWSEPDLSRSSLLYIDGHFICLTEMGELLLLAANPQKFDQVGKLVLTETAAGPSLPGVGPKQLLEYPAWAAPIVSHGLLYVRGKDRLVCLELIPPR